KKVEEMLPGDTVWSYDLQNGMSIQPDVVTHVGSRTAQLWEVRYGTRGHGRLLLTEEHPIWTEKGWKTVKELDSGDLMMKVWYQNTKIWKE
ncbi:MAG: hypothetical protein HYZ12_02485, partial [Thaumarchaeota archaeon]|nr:hypothetical protein [Nitrososphaerota archaeon]